jgi:hypothetical protein
MICANDGCNANSGQQKRAGWLYKSLREEKRHSKRLPQANNSLGFT